MMWAKNDNDHLSRLSPRTEVHCRKAPGRLSDLIAFFKGLENHNIDTTLSTYDLVKVKRVGAKEACVASLWPAVDWFKTKE